MTFRSIRLGEQFAAAIIAFLILFSGIHLASSGQKYLDQMSAESTWMEVHSIRVPSFTIGENPPVKFTRTIHREMRGHYIVEVRRFGEGEQGCTGSGDGVYSVSETRTIILPISDFIGYPPCTRWSSGKFVLHVEWIMVSESGVRKTVRADSNVFEVMQ